MKSNEKIILFDGVCKLCNAWCRFIIRHDKEHIFKLTAMQSTKGIEVLKHFNLPQQYFDSMLFIEDGTLYTQSTAFLKIVKYLDLPIKLFVVFKFIPKFIRDAVYNVIASNRYSIFGKYDKCILPPADHDNRYL